MADEPDITKQPRDLPTPKPGASQDPKPASTKRKARAWQVLGTVLLCFVASFLGAWVLLATGLVHADVSRSITDNKQTLVLQQGEIVAEVFKKVNPSTVAITTETVDTSQRFYAPQVSKSAGSGVIVSKDGYVLTNKHVVPDGVNSVTVITADGKQYADAKVVARDPANDIAFLKISGANDLTAAAMGDSSQVEPGQQVVAIGNALGLFRNSVTSGIISGIGRPIQASDESGAAAEQLEDMLQTDAAINPGNSGGPLVNLKGEVIGMNTAVSADGQGIGFAIPINSIKGDLESVLKTGKIVKAYLGIRYISIDQDIATQLKLSVTKGALIRGGGGQPGTVPGGPADKAGLRDGDIIVKINGKEIGTGAGLATQLAQFAPDNKVELTILRSGKEEKATVTLGVFPQ